jgi:hypothetical protein
MSNRDLMAAALQPVYGSSGNLADWEGRHWVDSGLPAAGPGDKASWYATAGAAGTHYGDLEADYWANVYGGGGADPGLTLLQSATLWLSASAGTAGEQEAVNQGTGGTGLNARYGSTSGVDTNDPLLLTHTGTNYLYLPGILGNFASTPDAAALDLTGDVELVARVAALDWSPAANMRIIGKRSTALGGNYELSLDASGFLAWANAASGGVASVSTAAVSFTDGTAGWVKVTYRNSDRRLQFFTAADSASEPGVFTQLGTDVTHLASGNIADTNTLCVGGIGSAFNPWSGNIYRAIVRNGIGGTTVFDADFTANTNQSSFTESSSNAATVTINRSTSGHKSVMVTRPVWLFGTDDYMEVADNALLDIGASDSVTVLAVMRRFNTAPANARVVSKRDGSGTNVGWDVLQDSTNNDVTALADVGASNNTFPTNVSAALTAGERVSIAAVFNRSDNTVKMAKGSTLSTGVTMVAGDASNAVAMRVGRLDGGTPAYNDMEIEHVAVFRSALTSTELGQIASYLGV